MCLTPILSYVFDSLVQVSRPLIKGNAASRNELKNQFVIKSCTCALLFYSTFNKLDIVRYLSTCSGSNFCRAVLVVSKKTLVHALIRGTEAWDNKLSLDFISSLCGCVGRNHHSILTPLQAGHGGPPGSTLQCNLVIGLCYGDDRRWCNGNNRSNWYWGDQKETSFKSAMNETWAMHFKPEKYKR